VDKKFMMPSKNSLEKCLKEKMEIAALSLNSPLRERELLLLLKLKLTEPKWLEFIPKVLQICFSQC